MKLIPYNISFFSALVFCTLLLLSACKEKEDYIPYVPVDFTIDLDKRNDLTIPGNSDYNEYLGYAGVIVVCVQHDAVTPSNSIYYAYDAACTHELSPDCPVISKNDGINATCECCGSEYTLFGGVPIKGEASIPLKEYNATVLGSKIRVYN